MALKVRGASDPGAVPLLGLPAPGELVTNPQLRAPAELAMFATGWAMLHEVRHLKHQQDFTSATESDPPELARVEELSCDRFAAEYLLTTAAQYAVAHSMDESTVRMKRALGVYFGMFALVVLAHPNWEETGSHPSVADRLRAMREVLSAKQLDEALCVAALALTGLKQVWPSAPGFVS